MGGGKTIPDRKPKYLHDNSIIERGGKENKNKKRARTYATECRISIVDERLILDFLHRYRSVFCFSRAGKVKDRGELWGVFFLFFFSFAHIRLERERDCFILGLCGFGSRFRALAWRFRRTSSHPVTDWRERREGEERETKRRGKKKEKKKERVREKIGKITIFVWDRKSQKLAEMRGVERSEVSVLFRLVWGGRERTNQD